MAGAANCNLRAESTYRMSMYTRNLQIRTQNHSRDAIQRNAKAQAQAIINILVPGIGFARGERSRRPLCRRTARARSSWAPSHKRRANPSPCCRALPPQRSVSRSRPALRCRTSPDVRSQELMSDEFHIKSGSHKTGLLSHMHDENDLK